MIRFDPEKHAYISNTDQVFTSATKLIGFYKQPFDGPKAAEKASKNRKSKWYRMKPEEIMDVWEKERNRSTSLGTWYHDEREKDLLNCKTISYNNYELAIYNCEYNTDGYKVAGEQKLTDGIYPEHFIYLNSAGVAGQSDRVTVSGGVVDILDYKTNKEIKTEGFKNYEGITQKMLFPLNHLDDCNLNHYTLQLSLYMYIVLKHNPIFSAGKLTLQHIVFEEEFDKDPYGYPQYTKDDNGNPIVKTVISYDVPYLKDEIITLLEHYKQNKK